MHFRQTYSYIGITDLLKRLNTYDYFIRLHDIKSINDGPGPHLHHRETCYNLTMKEAMFYEKMQNSDVRCHLCSHNCLIKNGHRGICAVRENREGILYSLVYGKVISSHIDPIEKKPLFHFLPESTSLSFATVGCNFRCKHCQNYDISQYPRERSFTVPGTDMTPEDIVDSALQNSCKSISYTYTEPTIFFEFAYDCAQTGPRKKASGMSL